MRAILTYHSLDDSGSAVSVSPAVFRTHIEWLAASDVSVVALDEIATVPEHQDAVAITFDDGFVNLGSVAAPLLLEYSMPATVFVVAQHVGQDNKWHGKKDVGIPVLPLLGWAGLGRCVEAGVTIGAHTLTHANLCQLPKARVREELVDAAAIIAGETGRAPTSLAYPYGACNAEVADLARNSYRIGVTTDLRCLGMDDDPLRLPRLDMYYLREAGQLERWGTGRFGRRLWFRRQARRVRRPWTIGAAR